MGIFHQLFCSPCISICQVSLLTEMPSLPIIRLCHHHPCKFGVRCHYPHTESELAEWEQRQQRVQYLVKQ